jgi:hypothetical protein
MRVAVIGSSSFENYGLLKSTFLNLIDEFGLSSICTGESDGADARPSSIAAEYKIPFTVLSTGNIVDGADAVVAFWDGAAPATSQAITYAEAKGKPVFVFPVA